MNTQQLWDFYESVTEEFGILGGYAIRSYCDLHLSINETKKFKTKDPVTMRNLNLNAMFLAIALQDETPGFDIRTETGRHGGITIYSLILSKLIEAEDILLKTKGNRGPRIRSCIDAFIERLTKTSGKLELVA